MIKLVRKSRPIGAMVVKPKQQHLRSVSCAFPFLFALLLSSQPPAFSLSESHESRPLHLVVESSGLVWPLVEEDI